MIVQSKFEQGKAKESKRMACGDASEEECSWYFIIIFFFEERKIQAEWTRFLLGLTLPAMMAFRVAANKEQGHRFNSRGCRLIENRFILATLFAACKAGPWQRWIACNFVGHRVTGNQRISLENAVGHHVGMRKSEGWISRLNGVPTGAASIDKHTSFFFTFQCALLRIEHVIAVITEQERHLGGAVRGPSPLFFPRLIFVRFSLILCWPITRRNVIRKTQNPKPLVVLSNIIETWRRLGRSVS